MSLPVHTFNRLRVNNIYVCNECNASFSGTGCIYKVRGHQELTGHTMRQIGE